eukprot:2623255-Amphidinium_carterae.1
MAESCVAPVDTAEQWEHPEMGGADDDGDAAIEEPEQVEVYDEHDPRALGTEHGLLFEYVDGWKGLDLLTRATR